LWAGFVWLREGPVASSCEYGDEPSGRIGGLGNVFTKHPGFPKDPTRSPHCTPSPPPPVRSLPESLHCDDALFLCSRSWALFWASCTAMTPIWPTGNSVATAEAAVTSPTQEYTATASLRASVHTSGRRHTLTRYSALCVSYKTVFYIVFFTLAPILS
jgi:hypothetical protein